MDWKIILLIIVGIILLIAFLFRKQIGHWSSALVHDYVYDWGLSTLDNLIGGFAGLDVGDWVGAFLIFRGEKKIIGTLPALIVAWEATNFIPLSFIPVVGEGIEVVTNIIPASTITRFLVAKYGPAERMEVRLMEEGAVMKQENINVPDFEGALNHIKELIDKNNPVEAYAMEKAIDKAVSQKLRIKIDKLVNQVDGEIQQLIQQDPEGTDDQLEVLTKGIELARTHLNDAKLFEKKKNFASAIKKAKEAQSVLSQSVDAFNESLSMEKAA